jgi:WD repeat-containing protein 1 (actin-interacting protein 1)
MASLTGGETKGEDLLQSGLYAPGPATLRANPSRIDTSPDGTLLIYPQGKNIVVRSIEEPNKGYVFQGHKSETTVARFSPNGALIASGDSTGFLKIWSWSEAAHTIQKDIKAMGSCIVDIAWGPDSKRIGIVGDGGQRARALLALSGSDIGPNMSGHIKKVLSVGYKQQKPTMMVTGGEDFQTIRHKGPPFKFEKSDKKSHKGSYINCIRFSPDGSKYCSVGSDKKVVIYNTEDGAVLKTLAGKAPMFKKGHKGGVYGCSWVDDSNILTCSADKTARVWNVEDGTSVTYNIAAKPSLKDMQVGCVVSSLGQMFSLSLSGEINILDSSNPSTPSRKIFGNNQSIFSMGFDAATGNLVAGDASGAVSCWPANAFAIPASGEVCEKRIACVAVGGGRFYSSGWDNIVRSGLFETGVYDTKVPLGGQPKANGLRICASNKALAVVASSDGIRLLRDGQEICFKPTDNCKPTCCDFSPDGTSVVIGIDNKKVCTLAVNGDNLDDIVELYTAPGEPTCVAYSPDGTHIAVGDKQREIQVWNVADGAKIISGGHWKSHGSAVTCLAWNPNSTHVATGSNDQNIFIWTILSKTKKEKLPLAHMFGPIIGVAWKDENTLISAGTDSVMKTWANLTLPTP